MGTNQSSCLRGLAEDKNTNLYSVTRVSKTVDTLLRPLCHTNVQRSVLKIVLLRSKMDFRTVKPTSVCISRAPRNKRLFQDVMTANMTWGINMRCEFDTEYDDEFALRSRLLGLLPFVIVVGVVVLTHNYLLLNNAEFCTSSGLLKIDGVKYEIPEKNILAQENPDHHQVRGR